MVGTSDVTDLSLAHQAIQCFQRLLQRRRGVRSVCLIKIYVVCAQAAQAGLNRLEKVLARQTSVVDARTSWLEALGGQNEIVPPILDRPADHFFRPARVIGIGS